MATISAGQFMESAEIAAVYAAVGKGGSATPYTTTYMALAQNATSGSIDDTWVLMSSGVTEQSGDGYARQPITTSSGWSTPTSASPSVISNAAVLSWGPVVTANWTQVNWGILASAVTAGIPLIAYLLTTPRTALIGDTVAGAIGAFTAQV